MIMQEELSAGVVNQVGGLIIKFYVFDSASLLRINGQRGTVGDGDSGSQCVGCLQISRSNRYICT